MEFEIRQNQFGGECHGLWYISNNDNYYIYRDLELHCETGAIEFGRKAPGYYATKAEAERYLRAYEVSQMRFIVYYNFGCGWYISPIEKIDGEFCYLWKTDLKLHKSTTGHVEYGKNAPGYYQNELHAQLTLLRFKEKHNMTQDNLEINVKLNGVDTPLHEISEETLLRIRKASKPKPIPVFQVCRYTKNDHRLVFKVTQHMIDVISRNWNNYVFMDQNGSIYGSSTEPNYLLYSNFRELKLDEV